MLPLEKQSFQNVINLFNELERLFIASLLDTDDDTRLANTKQATVISQQLFNATASSTSPEILVYFRCRSQASEVLINLFDAEEATRLEFIRGLKALMMELVEKQNDSSNEDDEE